MHEQLFKCVSHMWHFDTRSNVTDRISIVAGSRVCSLLAGFVVTINDSVTVLKRHCNLYMLLVCRVHCQFESVQS